MGLSDQDRYLMSLNAIKLIKENFDSKKIFCLYENLYRKLLQ